MHHPVAIEHNLDPRKFRWLWAKYVVGSNLSHHCTASLKAAPVSGPSGRVVRYSRRLSKASNPTLLLDRVLIMDEAIDAGSLPIYICGVSAQGYASGANYRHNLHAAVLPMSGTSDTYEFERWRITVRNGMFTQIPDATQLPCDLRQLPEEYVSCRIFRWAAAVLPLIGRSDPREFLLHPELV